MPRPGDIPFAIVERLVDDVVTVTEDALSRAILLLLERAKLVVEPAGAAAVATGIAAAISSSAWWPKTSATAAHSVLSFAAVPVPWALM